MKQARPYPFCPKVGAGREVTLQQLLAPVPQHLRVGARDLPRPAVLRRLHRQLLDERLLLLRARERVAQQARDP